MTPPPRRPPHTPDEELLSAEWSRVSSELSDPERVERMGAELERAFGVLSEVRGGVTVFGSARLGSGTPEHATAVELGRRLALEAGATVITGGGPGIMEAANRGAYAAGGGSVGLPIDLPFETGSNPFLRTEVDFHYFFTRKVAFVRYAVAFVVLPGGFGTLDELFEVLCLIQTEKIGRRPVILHGREFWGELVGWLRSRLADEGLIGPGDPDLLVLTDDLDEVVARCAEACAEQREHGAIDAPAAPG